MWPDLLAFAGVMALGQFSPGPDMLLLTRTSLAHGRAAGWWTTVGITTGLCLHAAVAILGMAYVMARGGWLAAGLRYAAAAYLGWLSLRLLRAAVRSAGGSGDERDAMASGRMACYRRGLLCNLLNPKAALFFAGIVTPFLSGERPAWWPAALWGIIVGQGLLLWGLFVLFLQFPPFRAGYRKAQRWIDAAFGLALAALAVLIVLA